MGRNEGKLLKFPIGYLKLSIQFFKSGVGISEFFIQIFGFFPLPIQLSGPFQYLLLKLILEIHRMCQEALEKDITVEKLDQLEANEQVARAKYIAEDQLGAFETIQDHMNEQIEQLTNRGVEEPREEQGQPEEGTGEHAERVSDHT